MTLYEHQKEALSKMKNGCILVGDVGSGKSITALAYYYTVECGGKLSSVKGRYDRPMTRPKPLYIITTAKKRNSLEWNGDAIYFGLSPIRELSAAEFVVDSWNNIGKYTDVKDAFFIFDEQRVVGSGAWVKAFLKITRSNRWILLSATPGDTWIDYIPVFIANGFYRNRSEFIREHIVYSRYAKFPKIERYINCNKLSKYKQDVVVLMPYVRDIVTKSEPVVCDFDKHLFMRVYRGRWNPYEDRPIKQAGEWCYLMRKIVNSDTSRLEKLAEIFERKKKVIIFYNFDYELEAIKEYFNRKYAQKDGFLLAEYNGHHHENVPDTPEWVYLVQYSAGSEAWNCITTDTIIFYSLNYSYKIMKQASGRINRMNSPFHELYYYILYSMSTIDRSILTSLKNKKDFNENKYISRRWSLDGIPRESDVQLVRESDRSEEEKLIEKYRLKESSLS